jgi:hypothetical protein
MKLTWLQAVNSLKVNRKVILVMLVALINSDRLSARSSALLNDGKNPRKDSVVYDFLFVGSKYQNQFAFLGRNFGQSIPFVTGDLTYYFNNRLWVSGSAFKFMDESIPFQTAVTAGYRADLSKRIDVNVSGGQFFIQSGEGSGSIEQLGFYQGGFGLDWTILYSTLQAQVMAFDDQDFFLISQHSRYFEFNEKLFNKIGVSFQPMFTITWGTNRFYYSEDPVLQNRGIKNPRALIRSAKNPSKGGTSSTPGNSGSTTPGQGNGQGNNGNNGNNGNSSNSGGNNTGAGTTTPEPLSEPTGSTEDGSKPGFLSWEFALPLTFQWGNFTLECTSRYATPLNVIAGDPSKPVFIQTFDLYYSIPVKRKKKVRI